jgi:hypothetical protein
VRSDDLTVALGTNLFDAAPIRGRAFSAMIAPPGYRCCGAIGTNDAKHLFWLRAAWANDSSAVQSSTPVPTRTSSETE